MEFDPADAMDVRDRAMFELFYSSGLRLSELTTLRVDAVSFDEETVRVTGKGNKTRVVPIGRLALEALERWLPVRAMLAEAGSSVLFLGRSGRPVAPHRAAAPAPGSLRGWRLRCIRMLRHSCLAW